MKNKILIAVILSVFCINISKATTWYPSEHKCPVCKKTNTYQDIGSYGNYIYSWPSKYQLIFWPLTDEPSIYSCIDCSFSSYMWDFDSIPENKMERIKLMLGTVKLDKKYSDYLDVPIIKRLEIAEYVYTILEKDNEFWNKFYRVFAYHCDLRTTRKELHFGGLLKKSNNDNAKLALMYRKKAINNALKMLVDTVHYGKEKEVTYIIGAMYFFTYQNDSAMMYMLKSQNYTYTNTKLKEENVKGYNEFLNKLILEYIEALKKEDD